MRVLLQRVTKASVKVDIKKITSIKKGLLVFVGLEKEDDEESANKMINKILNMRIFSDSNDKMNLNVQDIKGDILLVSQFTLAADTKSGNRPGFSSAMPPITAKYLYDYCVNYAKELYPNIKSGIFGANMQVSLVNDGPVTFLLEC